MDELSTLLAEPGRVEIGGRTVEVKPLTVRQLAPFARVLRPLAGELEQLLGGAGPSLDGWLGLIEAHGERLIDAAEIAAPALSHEQIEALPLDEFAALVMAVLEVNTDFFARRLLPSLEGKVAAVTQRIESRIGGMSGSD